MTIMKIPLSLPETDESVSIGFLHLKLRTFKLLNERGITNIADLNHLIAENFKKSRLSQTAITDVLEVLNHLSESINADGHVDWSEFWRRRGLTILPRNHKRGGSPQQILSELPTTIKEILSHDQDTDKLWRTVQRRFGLQGTKEMTLDEIGKAFSLTRERVRQLEAKGLTELNEVLVERRYVGKGYHVHPDVNDFVTRLFDAIATDSTGFVLETELLERCGRAVGASINPGDSAVLFLVFQLFGLTPLNIETYQSTRIWEYGDTKQRSLLEKSIKIIDEILTSENTTALDEFDILVKVNSRLPKLQKIDMLTLHKFLEVCGSVEKISDGMFQGKFEFLTRGTQAERVLSEAKEPLHVEEIAREINRRLVSKGKRKVQVLNIANIMSSDERFVAVGSSGQRGLKKWTDREYGSIVDVMEKCLMTLNRPATEEEIYDYVAERRPVSKQSIPMYLESQPIFRKADRKRWGLSSWTETKDALIWSPEQVADFVAKIFRQRKVGEIEFKIITNALKDAAGVSTSQATGMLKVNPVVSSRRQERPFKIVAVFNSNYKNDLSAGTFKLRRKTETKLQRAKTLVREMLEKEPSSQIELSKIVEELKSKYGYHEKTAYQYISRMDFVEKIDLPESGVRICRIKGKKTATFPQLEVLKTLDKRKAEEASKAVAKLTPDEVDNGLFMLGRLFENTLKDFMTTAEATHTYTVTAGNYSKLNNMIQWIESQGLVSDKTTLNFLRLERNERAHGSVPSRRELEMMLKAAPWMASLYLDQIVHFSERTAAMMVSE